MEGPFSSGREKTYRQVNCVQYIHVRVSIMLIHIVAHRSLAVCLASYQMKKRISVIKITLVKCLFLE